MGIYELSEEQVEKYHQEIRDWVDEVLAGKWGNEVHNLLTGFVGNLRDMEDVFKREARKKERAIARNRKMLGLPPLKKRVDKQHI